MQKNKEQSRKEYLFVTESVKNYKFYFPENNINALIKTFSQNNQKFYFGNRFKSKRRFLM